MRVAFVALIYIASALSVVPEPAVAYPPNTLRRASDENHASAISISANEAKRLALGHLGLVEDPSVRRVDVKRDGENWSVLVERLPEAPGAFVIVIVSPEGKILQVYSGQ